MRSAVYSIISVALVGMIALVSGCGSDDPAAKGRARAQEQAAYAAEQRRIESEQAAANRAVRQEEQARIEAEWAAKSPQEKQASCAAVEYEEYDPARDACVASLSWCISLVEAPPSGRDDFVAYADWVRCKSDQRDALEERGLLARGDAMYSGE
jgi:hypothetical protein